MYNAFVSTMDEMIGEVLGKVDELGLREDTMVIFQSDHGHSTEERTFFGGGNPGPYRGAKGCLFEGGIRVPSIVSLPGRIPQGETRDQMAVGCDWLPTIAEIAGVAKPNRKLDGLSIVRMIQSASAASPHKGAFYWQLGGGRGAQWVVREGNWKLLGNPKDRSDMAPIGPNDKLFLVDMAADIKEMNNLAAKHPEVVKRLSARQRELMEDIQRK